MFIDVYIEREAPPHITICTNCSLVKKSYLFAGIYILR
jgi:hypothetical protein